jgi:uncharacterized MAPEG superfamily protein
MTETLIPYTALIQASTVLAALVLVQVLVTDFANLRAKHLPGAPVPVDHKLFLFRAARAHANTLENLATQVLLVVLAILAAASPKWAGIAAWGFTAARAGHMVCYYGDWRLARSVAFGVGLFAQFALLALVVLALL